MPGIGDVMEGAMQHAPHSGRQFTNSKAGLATKKHKNAQKRYTDRPTFLRRFVPLCG